MNEAISFVEILEKFGLPTAFLAVMVWLFVWIVKQHNAERTEWRAEHRSERTEWGDSRSELQSETNKALRELTEVIAKINRE